MTLPMTVDDLKMLIADKEIDLCWFRRRVADLESQLAAAHAATSKQEAAANGASS